MSSELKTNKISPATGTTTTLGDASDVFQLPASAEIDIASGATLDVNGTIDVTGATKTGFPDNTPSFAAHRTTTQSIPNDTATKVQFDVELWDTDGAYDHSTNYRFTVPSGGAGKYSVTWLASMAYIDDGEGTWALLYKNGSSIGISPYSFYSANTNQGAALSTTWNLELADSDYLEVYIWHNEGSAANLLANRTFFSGYRLIGV